MLPLPLSVTVVCTDGDDDTLVLLRRNVAAADTEDCVEVKKLYWGEEVLLFLQDCQPLLQCCSAVGGLPEAPPTASAATSTATNARGSDTTATATATATPIPPAPASTVAAAVPVLRFSRVLGADIIYETEQVVPMMDTVASILTGG